MSSLLGKRPTCAVEDRLPRRSFQSVPHADKAKLEFILANAHGDERPYLTVDILGKTFTGLLDSGASRTIFGQEGWNFLKRLGLPISRQTTFCTVANGDRVKVLGEVSVPIKVRDREKVITSLVVPNVSTPLILGSDFWKAMGIVPDLRKGEWIFSNQPLVSDGDASISVITAEQQSKLDDVIARCFPDAKDETLGCAKGVEHTIITNSPPIKQRYYPISPAMQKVVDAELEKMLSLGVVERSQSGWSSPILLVPKKDKTYRFCVDYRKLNQVTERDAYPLPYVANTLDKLRDAKFMTSLDIKSAYWQIPVAESSRQYTAFTIPNRGLYQFKRMPFGLHNGPATWQRFIDTVLGPELEPYVFVYLDDILIVTPTYDKHITILEEVLKRIKDAGLTLNREKCQFCRDELKYLGYVVNKHGLLVDPDKIKAILQIPTPKTVSEVRRIVGMCSWYRRFVPNFSTVISPLTALLRKNRPFCWTEHCEKSWSQLKNCLVTAPVLSCPNFEHPFTIQTDASDYGLGAVLTQTIEDNEYVISYLSRSLTPQERKYSTTEKECLAVLWAIEKLRPYIEGSRFTVITDHYSLCWLNKLNSPSGRLARWAVRLQQFDFDVIHRKGKYHVVPDALSRSVPKIDTIEIQPETSDNWYCKLRRAVQINPERYPAFRVVNGLLLKLAPSTYLLPAEEVDLWKIVVPKDQRTAVIRSAHDEPTSGHLGVFKTMARISQDYFWPKMLADVNRYVSRCTTCLKTKADNRRPIGRMGGHSKITKPWEAISVDIVGPLPRTKRGYQFILVISDLFSKFVLTFPMRKATAKTVTEHLENSVFLMFGVPRLVISDNGVQFRSREYLALMKRYQVRPSYTSYYHPQANPVERVNRVLKTMLIAYVSDNQRNWDTMLPKVTCAIRTARHEVTGQTPYFVNFGREMHHSGIRQMQPPLSPDDAPIEMDRDPEVLAQRTAGFAELYSDICKRLQRAYERSKARYDLRHRREDFVPNQLVWRKNFALSDATRYYTAKLAEKYIGPFMIHKRVSTDSYELKTCEGEPLPGTWHASHLRAQPSDD